MSYARHRLASYLALAIAVGLSLSACSSSTPDSKAKPSSATSATSAVAWNAVPPVTAPAADQITTIPTK
jgi:pectin methylesterase-like acyl-CoA thioesterase